ncbi:MAG: hypothetical protein AAF564_21900 [Bacteroidota bacterium]
MSPTRRTFVKQVASGLACSTLLTMNTLGSSARGKGPVVGDFHLTARPWHPLTTSAADILDAVEGICRFTVQHQDDDGAIIDPFLKREHQYATPYFAHAMGTVLHAGRSMDLLDAGVLAMERATRAFSQGHKNIPDGHGEFFIAPLTTALALYETLVDEARIAVWRERLSVDVRQVMKGMRSRTNNWRTYPMKGEWLRYQAGLVDRGAAVAFIEDGWHRRSQRERIAGDAWNLYQDWSSHRQSHAVEAVGRGNLLALVASGYDGPSASEINALVERGTETSLWLQDPSGQCPPNGRTDNHVFNDVLYQLIFEVMAERTAAQGDHYRAGQYRRAAQLAFQSIQRWKRHDEPWTGSFYVTKNFFDPARRIGYQPASQYSNYNGAVMYHLAEAYHARQSAIEEQPAPAELGGFVRMMDPRFGSVVANAGGMQVFVNLKGDTIPKYKIFWTPLGAVRFARTGWDSRLGPSDGVALYREQKGLTFGPAVRERTGWRYLAAHAKDYEGTLRIDFEHPLLVKFTVVYAPITGSGGAIYYHHFVVTPDGVLTRLTSPHDTELGLTLPLLENDGRALETAVEARAASTKYPDGLGNGDAQHYLLLNEGVLAPGASLQSTYGWLKPVLVTTPADSIDLFVYPKSAADPAGVAVQESFVQTATGFRTLLGEVDGTLYIGRFAAGGFGNRLEFRQDATSKLDFDKPCNFVAQHINGSITAIESDRPVTVTYKGEKLALGAFEPLYL